MFRSLPNAELCLRNVLLLIALIALGTNVSASEPRASQRAEPFEVVSSGHFMTPSGEVVHYTKTLTDGEDSVVYKIADRSLSQEELWQLEASRPQPTLSEALELKALGADADSKLTLFVQLQQRPGSRIAREVRAAWKPRLQAKAKSIQEIYRSLLPRDSLSPAEEDGMKQTLKGGHRPLSEEQRHAVRATAAELETMSSHLRADIRQQVEAAVADELRQVTAAVQSLGGSVEHRLPMANALQVTLPANQLQLLAREPKVARIWEVPEGQLELDHHATSLGLTDGFWVEGVDGGVWDVGVLDTGVQQDHPALSNVYFLSSVGTNDSTGHGTNVAGILASNNGQYLGTAFDLERMFVGRCATNVTIHADWMTNHHADDPEAINLGCGYGLISVLEYDSFDQYWDALVEDHDVLVVKGAGNAGSGANTLTEPTPMNTLTVANMDDQNTPERDDDIIRHTSSRGPTLGGRRLPHLTAPGHLTQTTSHLWASGPDFTDFSGTSAASAHAAGAAVLLTDLRSDDNPMAIKAVLINTADAWTDGGTPTDTTDDGEVLGSEWNGTYGWGYLDLWKAWFNGLDVFTDQVDDGITPPGRDFKLYTGRMFGNEKATLVWNTHPGDGPIGTLSDLDLMAFRESNGTLLDQSVARWDNVEQISVPQTEDVVLKVDVIGSLHADTSIEPFALATEENFREVQGPSFSFSAAPTGLLNGVPRDFTVTINNTGDVTAVHNAVTLSLPTGMSLVSGGLTQIANNIPPGGSSTLTWRIRWDGCGNLQTANITFVNNNTSYGERFTGSGSKTMYCL